jgi:hypothetical protein
LVGNAMTDLRHLHRCMTDRRQVLLQDGRTGKIVRVDTRFPENETTVSVWTTTPLGPGVAKVALKEVLGPTSDKESA